MKLLLSSVRMYRAALVRKWCEVNQQDALLEERIRTCNRLILKLVQEANL